MLIFSDLDSPDVKNGRLFCIPGLIETKGKITIDEGLMRLKEPHAGKKTGLTQRAARLSG
jgi:hypothetical protein